MTTNTERWITLEEAADHLSVSKSYLYQQGRALGVPRVKLGNSYRYKISDLDAWLLGKSSQE